MVERAGCHGRPVGQRDRVTAVVEDRLRCIALPEAGAAA